MGKLVIYDTNDFDLCGDIDEEFYSREFSNYERIVSRYRERGNALAIMNSDLMSLCFKAKRNTGFAQESYQKQARAVRLIMGELLGV